MALYYLRNPLHLFHDLVELCGILEIKTYVGTCFISYLGRIHEVARADEDAEVC